MVDPNLKGGSCQVRLGKSVFDSRKTDTELPKSAIVLPKLYSIYTTDLPKPDIPWEKNTLVVSAANSAAIESQ